MAMGRYRGAICANVDVDIYFSDIADQISDEELVAELERRRRPVNDAADAIIAAARELHDAVIGRNLAEAEYILERLLLPKWRTRAACQIDYEGLFPRAKRAA